MAGWFRKGLSPHHTALAMIGVKAGDRVIVVGATDPDLAAQVALVTGLNGSTTVIDDRADARDRVEAAAREAGALVEFVPGTLGSLPAEGNSADVVVLLARLGSIEAGGRTAPITEAARVLRPGGRIIVIEGARSGGLFRALQEKPPRLAAEEVLRLLEHSGMTARRQLADVEGVAFYEGRKPQT
jgi:ubiquinone/menaquinone biosynthesis C-methylase UbiE